MGRSTTSDRRRPDRVALTGVVLGALLGIFGVLGLSGVSPTHSEPATVTGVDTERPRRGDRDRLMLFVVGETESGLGFRLESPDVYTHVQSLGLPQPAEAVVTDWNDRVIELSVGTVTGGRGRGPYRWMLLAAAFLVVSSVRAAVAVRRTGDGAFVAFALAFVGALVAGGLISRIWAG